MRVTGGIVGLVATNAPVASLAPSAVAGQDPASPGRDAAGPAAAKAGDAYGNLWNILPPGSRGNVTTLDLPTILGSTASPTAPPNVADQLEMYDALTQHDPDRIGRADLDQLYKRADFTPATVVSTKSPRPGRCLSLIHI